MGTLNQETPKRNTGSPQSSPMPPVKKADGHQMGKNYAEKGERSERASDRSSDREWNKPVEVMASGQAKQAQPKQVKPDQREETGSDKGSLPRDASRH